MTDHQEATTPPENKEDVIIVEWATSRGGIQKASRGELIQKMQDEAERAINIAMGSIRSMARRVAKTMDALDDKVRPDEAEIEFGINLDAEAGAFLAKASSGAQITVKLKWSIEKPERPKVFVSE